MQNIQTWMQKVQELSDALSAAGQLGLCRFCQDARRLPGCEQPEYCDDDWKLVLGKSAPIFGIDVSGGKEQAQEREYEVCDWSMADGAAALRKCIAYPDAVENLPTVGGKVYLTITVLAPIKVYLNGTQIADYPFWGDSRQCELVLSESHQPGAQYLVVMKTPHTEGDAHLGIYVNNSHVEQKILELSTAIEQLRFTLKLARMEPAAYAPTLQALEEKLNPAVVEARDWAAIDAQLAQIDQALQTVDSYAKTFKVHMIAHAHMDMNWLWDYEDTVDLVVRDFRTVCDILDEYPDMRFSLSQTCVYEIVQQHDPETFQRALRLIAQGRWEVTAATWSENDINMVSGEGMAHNLLSAQEYVKNVLHTTPSRVCWEPDTFGHPVNTPNVLVKAGVEFYYHFRNQPGHGLSWFEGTDGSRVLSYAFGPYNNVIRTANVMPCVDCMFDKYGLKTSMFVYGVGDHGGGPTRADIAVKHYLDKKPGLPRFVFSRVADFFDEVLQQRRDFPVVRGEMNTLFEGCYTVRSKTKKMIRDSEVCLSNAESAEAYRMLTGGQATHTDAMRKAWQDYGFVGFHDIICGCNIQKAIAHQTARGVSIRETADRVLTGLLPQTQTENVISVYNQLAYPRTELVGVDVRQRQLPQQGWLTDENGLRTAYQVEGGKLWFVARNMPAMAISRYTVCGASPLRAPVSAEQAGGSIDHGGFYRMQTARYLLEISRHTGTIWKLYDKVQQRDVLERMNPYFESPTSFTAHQSSNVLRLSYEQPQIMTAWILGNELSTHNLIERPQIRICAQGGVFATVEVVHTWHDSTFKQYITLYHDLDRVDFKIDVDWHEFGDHHVGTPMLRVGITSDIASCEYRYEALYGNVLRSKSNREVPGNRYIALCGKDRTMALFNDCKYGFMTQGSTMFMSLVRASYSPGGRPDEGPMQARYAIMPYYGLLDEAQLTKDAHSFNQPPIASFGAAAQADAGIFCEQPNVMLTCVKPTYDAQRVVVRAAELNGKQTDLRIRVPASVTRAYLSNLSEAVLAPLPICDGYVHCGIRAHEVQTILLDVK